VANNNVSGTLPESWLALVPGLTWLELANNAIGGSIPSGIANLTNLDTLDLAMNMLVGSIPSGIADLTALLNLQVHQNKLTGVVPDLPFANYTNGCYLQDSKAPGNAYACPLPADSASCKQGPPTCSCTGSSSSLPQKECEWWINFFDTMGGTEWTNCAIHRTDPCACSYDCKKGRCYGVTCSTNGHITKL
jgi:hypothetical protein